MLRALCLSSSKHTHTHPQSETNSHVSKIRVVSNIIKVPFAFKSNSTTSLSLSLSLSNLQTPSQAKKAEHSHSTAQHSTAQRNRSKIQTSMRFAHFLIWGNSLSLSLSLSVLLFGFHAYWKLYSFHYGIESISIIFFYIWIWVHRLWFPLHSLTMYWMSDRFCLFCSLFLILDLDLAFEVQFFYLILLRLSWLLEILNILLFSELFVCFLRYWRRKRCWIYWIFLNLGLNKVDWVLFLEAKTPYMVKYLYI